MRFTPRSGVHAATRNIALLRPAIREIVFYIKEPSEKSSAPPKKKNVHSSRFHDASSA